MTKKEKKELKNSINEQVVQKLLELAQNSLELEQIKKLAVYFELVNELPVKKTTKPSPSL